MNRLILLVAISFSATSLHPAHAQSVRAASPALPLCAPGEDIYCDDTSHRVCAADGRAWSQCEIGKPDPTRRGKLRIRSEAPDVAAWSHRSETLDTIGEYAMYPGLGLAVLGFSIGAYGMAEGDDDNAGSGAALLLLGGGVIVTGIILQTIGSGYTARMIPWVAQARAGQGGWAGRDSGLTLGFGPRGVGVCW